MGIVFTILATLFFGPIAGLGVAVVLGVISGAFALLLTGHPWFALASWLLLG